MTVKERLIKFAKSQEKSVRAFEIKTGLSVGYINAIRVSIQPDKIQRIASQYPNLNTEWLLTGSGSMLKNEDGCKVEHIKRNGKEDINLSDLIDAVNSIAKVSANNSETEKIRAETDRIKAEEDKIRAEAELKRAEVEDRNSRNMEELIMLLKSEKQDGSDRMRVKKEILY